jgi:hypothetical protein
MTGVMIKFREQVQWCDPSSVNDCKIKATNERGAPSQVQTERRVHLRTFPAS